MKKADHIYCTVACLSCGEPMDYSNGIYSCKYCNTELKLTLRSESQIREVHRIIDTSKCKTFKED